MIKEFIRKIKIKDQKKEEDIRIKMNNIKKNKKGSIQKNLRKCYNWMLLQDKD